MSKMAEEAKRVEVINEHVAYTTMLEAHIQELEVALRRCRTVLGNMAMENEGAIFNRWPINHEPLRNDARNLLPVIDDLVGKLP